MATGTATVAWLRLSGPDLEWDQTKSPQPPSPIDIVHGSTITFDVGVTGNWSNTSLTGTFTEGSFTIGVSSTSGQCAIGQQLVGVAVSTEEQYLPNGPTNFVTGLTSSTITFTNTPGTGTPIPALASGSSVPVTVLSQWPVGSLAVTVSPTTGATVSDENCDGHGDIGYIGNGTYILNYESEGEGGFQVTFADAGTFTVSVEYMESDIAYNNTALSEPLSFVVS